MLGQPWRGDHNVGGPDQHFEAAGAGRGLQIEAESPGGRRRDCVGAVVEDDDGVAPRRERSGHGLVGRTEPGKQQRRGHLERGGGGTRPHGVSLEIESTMPVFTASP